MLTTNYRFYTYIVACEGVTFTGDPEGVVKKLATALDLLVTNINTGNVIDGLLLLEARALLSQVQLAAEPDAEMQRGANK